MGLSRAPARAFPSWPRWSGPARHIVVLAADGAVMSPPGVRAALEFAFSVPGPLVVELVADDARAAWPAAWFAAFWAPRKASWERRALALELRCGSPLGAKAAAALRDQGVLVRRELEAAGPPPARLEPGAAALLRVGPGARDAEGWVDALRGAGCESVWIEPRLPLDAAGAPAYARFHERCLARMIALGAPRDEAVLALLAESPLTLRGMDVLGELAYAPDGRLFSSEAAWRAGQEAFAFGPVAELRFSSLAESPAVQACLAAALASNQPRCLHCVYSRYCTLPPSANLRLQGTVWGQTPSSPLCQARMALLDRVCARLEGERDASWLRAWR